MRAILRWFLIAALGLGVLPAEAQVYPNIPANTLLGRFGAGQAGQPQPLPFTQVAPALLAQTTTAPVLPVVHPSSGNLQGNGCAIAHQMWWVDQNLCSVADHYQFTSTDPSALMQITIGGSVTAGDQVTLTFKFGSGACASGGGGCAISYTATNLDTTTTIAEALACAVTANTTLFTLNGATCANGVLTAGSAGAYGGYGSSAQIGFIVANATNVISLDFNSTASMGLTSSVSGSATETVTISNSGCGSICSNAWDGAPGFSVYHFVSGIAPAANSNIGAWEFLSNSSTSLTAANVAYAQINAQVINSTSGSLQGRLQLLTTSTGGSLSQGVEIGSGLYTIGTTDKGLDTVNAKQSWINSAYEILQSSNTFRFDTLATNHPIVFNSGGGYGFGQSPSANEVEAGTSISAFGTGNPTAGTGISLFGGTPPEIFCFNWSTSSYVACQLDALSFDIQPSGSTSTGVKFQANSMAPDTNNATASGGSSLRWSTVWTTALNASGTATMADTGTWGSSGIGGTTINSSAIGGTTPAAGKFTTGNFSGQLTSTTGLPTIASGACGATTNGAVVAGSTNQSGSITIGSAATTTCTVSWSATLAAVPNACMITPANAAAAATGTTVARVSSITNAQFVITGSALANANYYYMCL